jgi:hypothetical protein
MINIFVFADSRKGIRGDKMSFGFMEDGLARNSFD